MFAVEDHAAQDGVHEGLQGGGGKIVLVGNSCQLAGVLVGFEALEAVADGLFIQSFARLQGVDVVGDVVAFIDEFGVGLNEADELFAAQFLLARRLAGVAGDEGHDVVVIDEGGGEQYELEIELLDFRVSFAARFVVLILLRFQALGGFQIGASEAQ